MTENGEMFANMCSLNSLIIGGSIFPHKRIHKVTWISPDGRTENQIDHFCISLKYRSSLQDVKVIRGADIGSDHHLLLAKVRLRLKKYKASTSKRQQKFNVNLLKSENTKREFSLELRNRFEALTDMDSEDVESHWEKLKVSYIETYKTVLGTKKREHKEWISQKSLSLIEERRQKKEIVNASRTRREKQEVLM